MPSPTLSTLIVLVVLLASGCTGPGREPQGAGETSPDPTTQAFKATLPMEIGPPVEGFNLATGLLGYTNCILLRPEGEGKTWRLLNGTLDVIWDDSDGSTISVNMTANDDRQVAFVPLQGSPIHLVLPPLNVSWQDPIWFELRATYPPGKTKIFSNATVAFGYLGAMPDVTDAFC